MPEQTNTYDSAYPAITDVVSRHYDNIVLVYGNSNRDRHNAIAFQIMRTVRRVERVHDAFDVAAGGVKEFGWFGENGFSTDVASPGDEVFSVQSERNRTLVEYGFAVPQDGVYVGIETAGAGVVDGLREGDDRARGLAAEDLDTRAGVASDHTYVAAPSVVPDSPLPTTALSETPGQGLIRIDSEQDGPNRFMFGFQNSTGASVTIDVIGMGQTYDVRPVEDRATARDIIAGDGYNRRVIQYGGMDATNPNLPRSWYDHAVGVNEAELAP